MQTDIHIYGNKKMDIYILVSRISDQGRLFWNYKHRGGGWIVECHFNIITREKKCKIWNFKGENKGGRKRGGGGGSRGRGVSKGKEGGRQGREEGVKNILDIRK